jgi:hypothetical protein
MVNENKSSWLIKTGQMWKFWLFLGFAGLDLFLFALMIWNINDPQGAIFRRIGVDQLQISTAFLVLAIVTLAQLFLSIKCPACRKRPVYQLVSKSGVNRWVTALTTFTSCPICGYSGNSKIQET